ncbi:MAG TPA: hypothetical protein VJB91_02465 [Patescibacteria group bacterium]|nr:hypothetical protein [Patescibacteria group bacterium]
MSNEYYFHDAPEEVTSKKKMTRLFLIGVFVLIFATVGVLVISQVTRTNNTTQDTKEEEEEVTAPLHIQDSDILQLEQDVASSEAKLKNFSLEDLQLVFPFLDVDILIED